MSGQTSALFYFIVTQKNLFGDWIDLYFIVLLWIPREQICILRQAIWQK